MALPFGYYPDSGYLTSKEFAEGQYWITTTDNTNTLQSTQVRQRRILHYTNDDNIRIEAEVQPDGTIHVDPAAFTELMKSLGYGEPDINKDYVLDPPQPDWGIRTL